LLSIKYANIKYIIANIEKANPRLIPGKYSFQYANNSYHINNNQAIIQIRRFLIHELLFEWGFVFLLSIKFLFINGNTQLLMAKNNIANIDK